MPPPPSCLPCCPTALSYLSGFWLHKPALRLFKKLSSTLNLAVQLTINEFADKSPEERNGLNGVRGMRKSPPPPAPPEASICAVWASFWVAVLLGRLELPGAD